MNKSIIGTQGSKATNLEATIKSAGLDWEPITEDVVSMTGAVMPRKKMIVRSDNHLPLGIVGEDYTPSNPRAFVENQYKLAESFGGEVARVGFMEERARAFAFINIGDVSIRRIGGKVGDTVRSYIYSIDGWDGGTPRLARLYVERLMCSNGQTSKKISSSMWVSHTKSMEANYTKRITPFVNEVKERRAMVENGFNRLASTKMDNAQMLEFLVKLIPGESTLTKNRRDQIGALFAGGIGNTGDSRWDAYNAVTEYVTHHRSYRSTDAASAETNRFLGVLETDTLSDKAMRLLN